jgi:hypothetical protein
MGTQANKLRRAEMYEVGDHVLLSTRFLKPPSDVARGRKLAIKYAGTYEVVKKVSPVAYEVRLPPGTNAHPVFYSSLLRSYNADSTVERSQAIPEPVCVEGQAEYVLRKSYSPVSTVVSSTGRDTIPMTQPGNIGRMSRVRRHDVSMRS